MINSASRLMTDTFSSICGVGCPWTLVQRDFDHVTKSSDQFYKVIVNIVSNPFYRYIRVTSVLHDDNKTYGKQFLLDGREDTCWNSDSVISRSYEKVIIFNMSHFLILGPSSIYYDFVLENC